jgi:glycosyltransferase involved in cell wall biosynthesis
VPGSTVVSVCIPTYNRAELVEEAVRSALAQTYEPLEVLVVDDASSDATVERLRAIDAGGKVRVVVNPRSLGQNGNRNRVIALSRGELVKFLDDDDRLHEDCVAKLVEVAARDTAIGFVFCRREIIGRADRGAWPPEFAEMHTKFAALSEVNDGWALLAEWVASELRGNWIGEPTTVLARRTHLERVGGFSRNIRQVIDADLWMRLMTCSLVGFVDEALVDYRVGHERVSSVNTRGRAHWLDRLWQLEGVASDPAVAGAYPQMEDWLRAERRQAWRTAARLGHPPGSQRVSVRPYFEYLRYRLSGSPLNGPVTPVVAA